MDKLTKIEEDKRLIRKLGEFSTTKDYPEKGKIIEAIQESILLKNVLLKKGLITQKDLEDEKK